MGLCGNYSFVKVLILKSTSKFRRKGAVCQCQRWMWMGFFLCNHIHLVWITQRLALVWVVNVQTRLFHPFILWLRLLLCCFVSLHKTLQKPFEISFFFLAVHNKGLSGKILPFKIDISNHDSSKPAHTHGTKKQAHAHTHSPHATTASVKLKMLHTGICFKCSPHLITIFAPCAFSLASILGPSA